MTTSVVPESSAEEAHAAVAGGRPWQRWVLLAVGLAAALSLPWFIYPPVAMDIAAMALFAVSLDILLGFVGLLSFGHAAFWGGSAYLTGLVAIHLRVPFPLAVLAGALFAMLLALPIGTSRYDARASTSRWSPWPSVRCSSSSPTSGAA